MKKGIIGLVAGLVVIGARVFILKSQSNMPADGGGAAATAGITDTNPWIEVLAPAVTKTSSTGTETEVKTGDMLGSGDKVRTDTHGLATIHFGDGSVARLDSATEITITESSYDPASQTLVVRMALGIGHLWSKVIGLATPESSWEVQTTSAVVTVRGTAFGVSRTKNSTDIIGSEHNVAVKARDNKTGKDSAEIIVDEKSFVSFGDGDASAIASGNKKLLARLATADMLKENWIQQARGADAELEQKLETLRAQGLTGMALRREIRRELYEDLRKRAGEKPANTQNVTPPIDRIKDGTPVPTTAKTSQTLPAPTVRSLKIVTKQTLTNVVENTAITFSAVLTLSDGTTKIVTNEAVWKVDRIIGSMTSPGVFMPVLDASVSEFGTATGVVRAVWKNPKTGETFNASQSLDVNAYVDPTTGDRG